MRVETRQKEEYGGYLPLELNRGTEYFSKYEDYLLRFNSVKASLDYLIAKIGLNRIYIPYYYCPSTIEAIRKMGVEVIFYHIDSNLLPIDLNDDCHSIILLVDYFGVKCEKINQLLCSLHNAEIIIDRAHAFYAEPVIGKRIHNVYSAKKFFGIPDGAYVVSKDFHKCEMSLSNASNYAEYLLKAYEEGTNAAYALKKESDVVVASNYALMSKLARGLLRNVDYESVKKRRTKNYKVLFQKFKDINELSLPEESPAYQFPLLISGIGEKIKKRLVEDKIFVSTLWCGVDLLNNGNRFEQNMSENAIFLPIDQRYDEKDMEFIAFHLFEIMDAIKNQEKS